ncbi:tRNA-uridine aminocarboxypropyltransferase [Shewanella sp. UCD-KL12]|uniref:tRNA-uridine aminocarboxypropyltransferase n=1 Tax=Shewanella sp. UCD-KL12 TaxID=1917163 RepID=UPI000971193F|nr:tRNA-uridine aminocarboxypropyltransferase [Shewanella sp. UCD-KL12]
MKFVLLTHERELLRTTNTGSLAVKAYPEWCERRVWSRVHPDEALVAQLKNHQAALLYPKLDGRGEPDITQSGQGIDLDQGNYIDSLPYTLIILDATWQEARKMIKRSPYLQLADKYALNTDTVSDFTLRRNQIEGGLCTLECIIEVCKVNGLLDEAHGLKIALTEFQLD